jgi:hypothetical protein
MARDAALKLPQNQQSSEKGAAAKNNNMDKDDSTTNKGKPIKFIGGIYGDGGFKGWLDVTKTKT